MAPFDLYLEKISKLISIKDEDRKPYRKDFENIRDHIFNIMKSHDRRFKKIFKGPSLFGSQANKARIFKPSEFDVLMQLSFPYTKYINIEEDEDNPGFVNLDFEYAMDELEDRDVEMFEFMESLVDPDNGYLLRTKLQRWLFNIINDTLKGNNRYVRDSYGGWFELEYSKRGLAHTIYARGPNYNISIDFVPAIMFGQEEWMEIRDEYPFENKCDRWYAVPKPALGPKHTRKYAFLISNPKVEHYLLLGKQHLKIVFRLLKSIFKKYEMCRLKGYIITTAFLWEIENQDEDFWNNPVSEILIHMLEVIKDDVFDGSMPFFWNPDLNLFSVLSEDTIDIYADKLIKIFNTLKQYQFEPNLSYKRCLSHFQMPEN